MGQGGARDGIDLRQEVWYDVHDELRVKGEGRRLRTDTDEKTAVMQRR